MINMWLREYIRAISANTQHHKDNVKLAFGTYDLKIFGSTDVFFGPYNNNLNKHGSKELKHV